MTIHGFSKLKESKSVFQVKVHKIFKKIKVWNRYILFMTCTIQRLSDLKEVW